VYFVQLFETISAFWDLFIVVFFLDFSFYHSRRRGFLISGIDFMAFFVSLARIPGGMDETV
jgi:hypothetical protein